MAIADPTLLLRARKLFPEFTDKEFEFGMLFGVGFTREDLVELKGVTMSQVDYLLRKIRLKLSVQNNGMIIPAVILRILLNSTLAA